MLNEKQLEIVKRAYVPLFDEVTDTLALVPSYFKHDLKESPSIIEEMVSDGPLFFFDTTGNLIGEGRYPVDIIGKDLVNITDESLDEDYRFEMISWDEFLDDFSMHSELDKTVLNAARKILRTQIQIVYDNYALPGDMVTVRPDPKKMNDDELLLAHKVLFGN